MCGHFMQHIKQQSIYIYMPLSFLNIPLQHTPSNYTSPVRNKEGNMWEGHVGGASAFIHD